MYNLRVKDYGNGQIQTSIYSHPVYTGEKKIENVPEYEETPFGGKARVVNDFESIADEHERSVQNSMKRAKNKIYDLSRSNEWDWFVTITFDAKKVDRYDYSACTKKLSDWLKNLKRDCVDDFKYLIVPERHKDGAFHFHGLMSDSEHLRMKFSGHYTKDKEPIYNIGRYKFGFTTATRVKNNEASTKYITKYTTKDLMEHTKNKRKYWHSRNLNTPKEYTAVLPASDLNALHDELVRDDVRNFKQLYYEIGVEARTVFYYEHIVKDGIGYDLSLFAQGDTYDTTNSV